MQTLVSSDENHKSPDMPHFRTCQEPLNLRWAWESLGCQEPLKENHGRDGMSWVRSVTPVYAGPHPAWLMRFGCPSWGGASSVIITYQVRHLSWVRDGESSESGPYNLLLWHMLVWPRVLQDRGRVAMSVLLLFPPLYGLGSWWIMQLDAVGRCVVFNDVPSGKLT